MSYGFRIVLATVLLAAVGRASLGQPNSDDASLNRPPVQHGVFLELSSRVTSLNNAAANFSGLRLNWAMRVGKRHQTFIGFAGHVLTTPVRQGRFSWTDCPTASTCSVQYEDLHLLAAYGGMDLRYSYRLNALFEVGGSTTIGPGYAVLSDSYDDDYDQRSPDPPQNEDAFVVVEPGVEFAYRPTRFFAVTVGGSYRYAPGFGIPRSSRFSGFSASVGLQFGWL